MPLVADSNLPHRLTLSFRDRDRDVRTVEMHYNPAVEFDTLITAVTADIAIVEALSDARLTAASLTYQFDVADPDALAPESSDVERKGSFVGRTQARTTTGWEIPSIKNSLVIDQTNQIDRTAAEVVAFIDTVETDTPAIVSGAGLAVRAVVSAEKIHRRSSNG